jgi:cation transport ATPase
MPIFAPMLNALKRGAPNPIEEEMDRLSQECGKCSAQIKKAQQAYDQHRDAMEQAVNQPANSETLPYLQLQSDQVDRAHQWLVQCHNAGLQEKANFDAARLRAIEYEQQDRQRRVTVEQNVILFLTLLAVSPLGIDAVFRWTLTRRIIDLFYTLYDSLVAVLDAI